MAAGEHWRVWRRPRPSDGVRAECGRQQRVSPHHGAASQRLVNYTDFNTLRLIPEVEKELTHGENETTQLVAISSKYMG